MENKRQYNPGPCKSYFDEICQRTGFLSYKKLKKTASDRHEWLHRDKPLKVHNETKVTIVILIFEFCPVSDFENRSCVFYKFLDIMDSYRYFKSDKSFSVEFHFSVSATIEFAMKAYL